MECAVTVPAEFINGYGFPRQRIGYVGEQADGWGEARVAHSRVRAAWRESRAHRTALLAPQPARPAGGRPRRSSTTGAVGEVWIARTAYRTSSGSVRVQGPATVRTRSAGATALSARTSGNGGASQPHRGRGVCVPTDGREPSGFGLMCAFGLFVAGTVFAVLCALPSGGPFTPTPDAGHSVPAPADVVLGTGR